LDVRQNELVILPDIVNSRKVTVKKVKKLNGFAHTVRAVTHIAQSTPVKVRVCGYSKELPAPWIFQAREEDPIQYLQTCIRATLLYPREKKRERII